MFVLGLLLLAAAVVGSVELILANRQPMTFHMWNWTWHVDAFWLAVIGAGLITVAWLALGAMRVSLMHQRRLRRERRELAAENERLAARVAAPAAVADDKRAARPVVAGNRPAQTQQYAPPPPVGAAGTTAPAVGQPVQSATASAPATEARR